MIRICAPFGPVTDNCQGNADLHFSLFEYLTYSHFFWSDLFARVELTFKQDCRDRPKRIGDPVLQQLDQFVPDGCHVYGMNADIRRQEARQTRVVASDDVDVSARLKAPSAERVQRPKQAQFIGARQARWRI